MLKRKNEAGKDKQPVDDLLRRTAGKRDNKRIVDTFHVANPRFDKRTVSIREEEKVIDQPEDQTRQNTIIDDVTDRQAPLFDIDQQRSLQLALARDSQPESAEHKDDDEA